VFRRLAEQKDSAIEEGHLMPDHVHMMISIPPKYAVSQVVGFIKGKSAIHIARVYSVASLHLWRKQARAQGRGCCQRRWTGPKAGAGGTSSPRSLSVRRASKPTIGRKRVSASATRPTATLPVG
jgi:hypothetical protein